MSKRSHTKVLLKVKIKNVFFSNVPTKDKLNKVAYGFDNHINSISSYKSVNFSFLMAKKEVTRH